jgi:hypothetical protein
MRTLCAGLVALPLILAASAAPAGLWDDVKSAVSDARETVDDVKSTRDEAKGTVEDAKGVVDDTSDDVDGVLPEKKKRSEPPPTPRATPPPPPSASPPPSAPPPPPPSARKWHVDTGGGQTREVSETELVKMIRSGDVGPDTYVYADSLGEWTAAGEVSALMRYFPK